MKQFWSLSAAGFFATAITYGPGRMGFGLFLPEFRSAFSLSTQTAGMISSLGFFGFFAGLLISQFMTNHRGPRMPVTAGLAAAAFGLCTVAMAPNIPVLALGVLLSMSSVGFSWSPFNNAVHREIDDMSRPAALSLVSTGTSLGIATAGLSALLMYLTGVSWRVCWAAFAAASVLALVGNWFALRSVATPSPASAVDEWRELLQRSAVPMYAVGMCYGITSAVYISFATDRIADAGGVAGLSADSSGSLVFIVYGLFGLLGLFTGRLKAVTGLTWLLRLLMLAAAGSCALIALAPASLAGLVASAGLQGINVMMMSAVLSFWSDRLFPDLPSEGFTAVLLAVAAGSAVGPIVAGFASEAFGPTAMFLGTAALAAIAAPALRFRHIRERPDGG